MKKWLLVIIILTGVLAWYYLFYKTYSKSVIPQNADIVLSIDVKRNTKSIIWYYLTTPSEWGMPSIFRKRTDSFNWKKAIDVPDYIFVFHLKGQPANAFYTVCDIADENDFKKGLIVYDFKERAKDEYYSEKLGLDLVKKGDRILIGNLQVKDKSFLHITAAELFDQQKYIAEDVLKKIIAPANHFSLYIQKNNFLQEDAMLNGNFKNGELVLDAIIQSKEQFSFIEDSFHLNKQSLLGLYFTEPPLPAYALIPDSVRSAASKALNFNIDSLFNGANKKYALNIQSFKERQDSAISYTYDDDFNKVENVIVNMVQEPSFNFSITKKYPSNNLFQYWKKNKNIEDTDTAQVFVSIPFVKTLVSDKPDFLLLTSNNYTAVNTKDQFHGIAYLNTNIGHIPDNLLNYLPDGLKKMVPKLETMNIVFNRAGTGISMRLNITNKDKKMPFLLSLR